jgi:exosortase E/protease (VPEID-CTERM system)
MQNSTQACTGSNHSHARLFYPLPRPLPGTLLGRLYLLALVLGLDCFLRSSLPHSQSLLGPLASFGIVAFAVFLGMGYSVLKAQQNELPFNGWLFLGHLICIAAVSLAAVPSIYGFSPWLLTATALDLSRSVTMLGIVLLALALVPFPVWIATRRLTGRLWLYATIAGGLAYALRSPLQAFWNDSNSLPGRVLQTAAFHAVYFVLHLFLPQLQVDPQTFTIGTPHFNVIIAQPCSGLEGLGLVLVFTTAWLWYFRKENRFPHALLLVPSALIAVWVLNILRITALVLIGNAGAPDVAMIGFHSQAGWIAFTTVALAFSMATRRLSWVQSRPVESTSSVSLPTSEARGESPATGAYLLPFLAILAASFVSKAVSGNFEWAYPLRFIAAAVVLWSFRGTYSKLNFRFGWRAPLTGVAVFLLWITPTLWSGQTSLSTIGASLAALPHASRLTWIVFRIAAAVITVPLAEELAFRGYLARRLMGRRFMARDFDQLPFRSLTLLPILLSSIAFGLMHGHNWMVGILAGLAFALVLRSKGRIGDAVAAHATANLLLAIWVLSRGDWAQW